MIIMTVIIMAAVIMAPTGPARTSPSALASLREETHPPQACGSDAQQQLANLKALVAERFFDDLVVVRSQDNYVVQWGDPLWQNALAFDEETRGTGTSQERAFGDNNDGMALFVDGERTILAANNEYTNRRIIYGNRPAAVPVDADDVRKGKAAHGARPELGSNAIHTLAKAIELVALAKAKAINTIGEAANTAAGQKAIQLDLAEQAIVAKQNIAKESTIVLMDGESNETSRVVSEAVAVVTAMNKSDAFNPSEAS